MSEPESKLESEPEKYPPKVREGRKVVCAGLCLIVAELEVVNGVLMGFSRGGDGDRDGADEMEEADRVS